MMVEVVDDHDLRKKSSLRKDLSHKDSRCLKKEPKQETTQYDILDIWRQNMLLMRANRLQDILVIDRMIREIEEIKKHAPGVQ